MQDWMAYVYQQQPKPANFTGVNVHLVILDSNNNWQDLGTTTTDSKGYYSLSWAPNIPGDFKVFATFDGTKGYWPSSSTTAFNIANASPTPSAYPITVIPQTEMYFIGSAIAIIAAIAIATLLILKKK